MSLYIFALPELERVAGIEPALSAWKAEVLPLNYTRLVPGLCEIWWREKDSNLRRLSRQIYSLIPLTAREPLRKRGAIFITWHHPVNTFISKNTYLKAIFSQQKRSPAQLHHRAGAILGDVGAFSNASTGLILMLHGRKICPQTR